VFGQAWPPGADPGTIAGERGVTMAVITAPEWSACWLAYGTQKQHLLYG